MNRGGLASEMRNEPFHTRLFLCREFQFCTEDGLQRDEMFKTRPFKSYDFNSEPLFAWWHKYTKTYIKYSKISCGMGHVLSLLHASFEGNRLI